LSLRVGNWLQYLAEAPIFIGKTQFCQGIYGGERVYAASRNYKLLVN
jgi:hypothetical protein